MGNKDSEKGKYTSPEGSPTWEYLSAMFMAFGMFSIGDMTGWSSPSMDELFGPNSPIKITPEEASTLMACLSVGQVLAVGCSVFIVDVIGRRKSVILSTLPAIIHWLMILLAQDVMVLIVARLLAGFSIGLIACTCPVYMAEVVSTSRRGSMSSMGLIMLYCGVLFMFVVAPYLGMRMTASICMCTTILLLICTWFLPESPYFLMRMGRVEEAEAALEKLRGKTDVTDELELIKATLREKGKSLLKTDETEKEMASTKNQSAFKQLFTIRGNVKAFAIGLTLSTLIHSCGLGTAMTYCHVILNAVGSELNLYLSTIIFSILQVFSASFTVLVVDKFGRRTLLFTSGVLSSILLFVITAYFYLMEYRGMDLKPYSIVPLGCIFLLVMAINVGVLPVTGVLMSEIFATDVKILANCIVGVTGGLIGALVAKSYLVIAISWGLGHSVPFFGYTASTTVCTALLTRLLPETKGKTLLEIQRELNA